MKYASQKINLNARHSKLCISLVWELRETKEQKFNMFVLKVKNALLTEKVQNTPKLYLMTYPEMI